MVPKTALEFKTQPAVRPERRVLPARIKLPAVNPLELCPCHPPVRHAVAIGRHEPVNVRAREDQIVLERGDDAFNVYAILQNFH